MRYPINKFMKVGKLTLKYSNLPERYVKRCTEMVEWSTPKLIQYRKAVVKRDKNFFDTHPPWTPEFERLNNKSIKHRNIYVEPIKDWSIFVGDRVQVLVGKDKGKLGIVQQVIQERNWVIVKGLNTYVTKTGKTDKIKGSYCQMEAPLLVPNEVSLVDPTDMQATTIQWRYTEAGAKVRVSVRTGRIISIPAEAEATYDYVKKVAYGDKENDTPARVVAEVTFEPSLATFEMDIMKEQGLFEGRDEAPTYWY